jgi:homoserine O-succinyltransferase/O-acetyltransferase
VPHSRHNGLSEEVLIAKGYEILSRSPKTGPDIFAKAGQSLFLFLQGHPEYDLGALLQEYRRDVGRFLCGKRPQYPEIPYGYFDSPTEAIFSTFRERAVRNPSAEMFAQFPTISREALSHRWREAAIHLYSDWLSFLQTHKVSTSKIGKQDQPAETPGAIDNILYLTPSTPVHAENSHKSSELEVEKCDCLTG